VQPGSGFYDSNKTQAQLRRLLITLSVFPPGALSATRKLAESTDYTQAHLRPLVDAATKELALEVVNLEG
jgi:hypothetical protein